MKKLAGLLVVFMLVVACQNSKNAQQTAQNGSDSLNARNVVEVNYFHGKQRCPTCVAIENETKQLLDSVYVSQLKDNSVRFRSIDISEKENQALVEKYEVTWSSLFVTYRNENGKDSVINLTDFAFSNARVRPDTFKMELKRVMDGFLSTQK